MAVKLFLKRNIADLVLRMNSLNGQGVSSKACIRVLTYHSIADEFINGEYAQMTTPKDLFEYQMRFLHENNYRSISCEDMVMSLISKKEIQPKSIAITFDDGFKDNLTNALPVLKKYGFKATIFLTTGFVGKNKDYLSWKDVDELLDSGLICFGLHTCMHKKLSGLSDAELDDELGLSKRILEEKTKRPVNIFAYPFGSYGSFCEKTVRVLKEKGYKAAFTTIAGTNTAETDMFRFRRTRISWYDDPAEFPKELSGAYDWYKLWQKISKTH